MVIRKMVALAILLGGVGSAVGFAAAAAGDHDGASEPPLEVTTPVAPPPPPWVNPDGTVDAARLPAEIGVAAFDGTPLRDGQGDLVMRSTDALFGPPIDLERRAVEAKEVAMLQEADAARRGIPMPPPPVVESHSFGKP